jgi:toxin ParE1/3/4
MMFEFHSDALAEYQAAARHYAECGNELDLRFISAVERCIDQIQQDPQRYRILEDDVHRCLTRVFPYAILYTVEPDFVLIIAVMHCHREPGYWRRRLKGNP